MQDVHQKSFAESM